MKYLNHPLVKIAVALLVLWLLWRNNILTWEDFSNEKIWKYYLISLALFPLAVLLGAYRVRTLFLAQGNNLPLKKMFSWNMIALFLASAFPTSMASEVVRYAYIADYLPEEGKFKIAGVILIDRVASLLSIFFLAALLGGLYWKHIEAFPELQIVVLLSFLITCFALVFMLLFGTKFYKSSLFENICDKILLGKYIKEFAFYFHNISVYRLGWVKILLANVLTHFIYVISWFCIVYTFGYTVDIAVAFVIFPFIPICLLFGFAGGIGLGTASSAFLLSQFLFIPHSGAVVLFSQGMSLIVAVLGGLPFYLMEDNSKRKIYKKKKT